MLDLSDEWNHIDQGMYQVPDGTLHSLFVYMSSYMYYH
jgi:hypothetical protein